MNTGRILIINPFGIGDVLFATPLIRRIRKQFPGAFIGFICNSRVAQLLSANKNLDEVFVFDKGDYRALWHKSKTGCIAEFFDFLKLIKSRNFDIAVDLSLGHQYAFFLMLLGVPVRIGYNFKNRGRFLTHRIDIAGYHDKHIVDYYLDLLDFFHEGRHCERAPKGRAKQSPCSEIASSVSTSSRLPRNDGGNLDIFIPQEDLDWVGNFLRDSGAAAGEKFFAVIPGGGASWGKTALYKHWSAENFAKTADELIEKYGGKAIIFGGPDDLDICENVSRAMRHRPIFACAKTSILRFAALLKKCDLAICNDGGPLHLAVAAGVKTISIFGPVDENVYGPYPPGAGHIVVKHDIDCRPCYEGFKFNQCESRICFLNIRPQDVIRAAERLLS